MPHLSIYICLVILVFQIVNSVSREIIFNPKPISSIRVSDIDNYTSFYQEITEDYKWAFLTRIEGGFCVISLEDIQQPRLVKIVETKGAYEIKVKSNYLFISDLVEGLVIFDITDPSNPQKIYTLANPVTAQAIAVTNDMKTLFLVAGGIAYCYDISNIYSPQFLSKAGIVDFQKTIFLFCLKFQSIYDNKKQVISENLPKKQIALKRLNQTNKFFYSYQIIFTNYSLQLQFNFINTQGNFSLPYIKIFKLYEFNYNIQQGISAPNTYKVKLDKTEKLLSIGNHISGLQIIDVRDRNNIKLRASVSTGSATWDTQFTPDSSVIYAADAYFGLSAASLSGILDIPKEKDDMFTLKLQNVFLSPQLTMSIQMTQLGDYLILGLRSIGLKLFKIKDSNYFSLNYIQDIDGSYLCNKILLSHDEKYAFASNGHSLVIYQSDQPQINKDFPNLFNTFQSSLVQEYKDPWAWEITCLNDNKHIIVAAGSDSTQIFSIQNPYQPVLISKIPPVQGTAYDSLTLLKTNDPQNILYLGSSEQGFFVYDISNLKSPKEKRHIIPSSIMNDSDGVQVNYDNSLLVISNGSIGISIYDIKTDMWNPILIAEFINKGQFLCTFEKCAITKSNEYLFGACREEGVVIFNFKDNILKPISIIKRVGTEYPILSPDETHLFIAVGFQGLIVVNIEDKLNPKIVSTLPIDGWAQTVHFMPMFENKYIIISQLEKGQLTIIDVQDLTNPYIFSIVNFPNESSSSFCITPDNKSIYFIGNIGMRFIPLESEIKIHTQISKSSVSSSGKVYYEILSMGQKLQVGQTVQMVFVPLEMKRKIKFSSVYYYRNYEKKSLPVWMTFYSSQQMIQMTVDKEGAFNTFSNEQKGENIIILEVMKEIFDYDFVNDNITQTMATAIYSSLQNQGIISTYNYLDATFDPNKFAQLDFYSNSIPKNSSTDGQIQAYIKQVLTFSKVDYPIRFYIESSLEFNYKTYLREEKVLLQTPSYQIIAYFNIKSNGKFMRKTFEGVLSSFSDDLTSVKIEGPSTKVNEIVSNSLQLANFTSNFKDIVITGRISDSSNYDLEFSETYDVFQNFIKLNRAVTLNQNLALQSQFSKFYDESNVSVEAKFQFTFDQNTFQDEDGQQITYKAYIVTDSSDEPVEIVQGSSQWIEFNPQFLVQINSLNLLILKIFSQKTQTFTGTKSISSFLTVERIKIVASDGFTEVSDQFTLYFNQLPFMFTMQLVFQIVGPLLGILGIWRYRSSIYLILMESSYMYSPDHATVGQLYRKQIVLFDDVKKNAQKLWKLYKKENQNYQKEIYEMYQKEKKININEIMKKMFQTFEKNQKNLRSLDLREFDFDESRLFRVIKGEVIKILLKKDKETKQVLYCLMKEGKKQYSRNDWYKKYVNIVPTFEAEQFKITNKNQSKLYNSQTQLLRQDNTNQLINPIYNDDIEKNNIINDQEQQNTETNNNIYKLKNEEKSDEIQEYKNLNPFPLFQVLDHIISEDVNKFYKKQCDNYLLTEAIIIEASGIGQSLFTINPNKGESLILQSHQISNISAYKKDDQGCCLCLRKLMKEDYKPIGLSLNDPLPKWLNCEIIDGVINIWGIPKAKDEPEILIRVVNELSFTIYCYIIIIKDKDGGELRDKAYVKGKDQQNKKMKSQMNFDSYFKSTKNTQLNDAKDKRIDKYKLKQNNIENNSEIYSHQNIFQNTLRSNQNIQLKLTPIQDIQQIFSVYSVSKRETKDDKNDSNEDIKQIDKKQINIKEEELNVSKETIPDENLSKALSEKQITQNWQQMHEILESKENLNLHKTHINLVHTIEDKIQMMSEKRDQSKKNNNKNTDQNY